MPEVETVRRTLLARIVGMRVARVEVRRGDVVEGWSAHDAGALLEGLRIAELRRHGKQLAIVGGALETNGVGHVGPEEAVRGDEARLAIVVQLGMTGQLVHRDRGEAAAWLAAATHVHVVWHLADGAGDVGMVAFRDPRRFGGVSVIGGEGALRARWAGLGPDGVGLCGEELWARVGGAGGSARAIKAALLDQWVVAGVGNIYADESLHRAGIRPGRACRRITRAGYERLATAVREVLAEAIEARGSTLRDYVDGNGERGAAQLAHRVYGRGGEACFGCGGVLRSGVVAQRTTVWCGVCQR